MKQKITYDSLKKDGWVYMGNITEMKDGKTIITNNKRLRKGGVVIDYIKGKIIIKKIPAINTIGRLNHLLNFPE